jgi:hypothetical protein
LFRRPYTGFLPVWFVSGVILLTISNQFRRRRSAFSVAGGGDLGVSGEDSSHPKPREGCVLARVSDWMVTINKVLLSQR